MIVLEILIVPFVAVLLLGFIFMIGTQGIENPDSINQVELSVEKYYQPYTILDSDVAVKAVPVLTVANSEECLLTMEPN